MSKIEKIAQNAQNGYSKKNNHFLLQFTNYNFYIFTNFDIKLARGEPVREVNFSKSELTYRLKNMNIQLSHVLSSSVLRF